MTDYWLNKLIFDLQGAGGKGLWTDPERRLAFIEGYNVSSTIRQALIEDDFATLRPVINAYLMRNFLLFNGLTDDESNQILHAMHDGPQPEDNPGETTHG
jgi:hypothetical protein